MPEVVGDSVTTQRAASAYAGLKSLPASEERLFNVAGLELIQVVKSVSH